VSLIVHEPLGPGDPLLAKILSAQSAVDDERSVEQLITDHALPVIHSVVRRRCRSWNDASAVSDDVPGEVIVHLLRRLRTLRREDAEPINSFDGYVAAVTTRVIDDLLRKRFPRRAQLKNRVRYLLRHDPRFVWTSSEEETVCALAERLVSKRHALHSWEVETLAQQMIRILQIRSPRGLEDLVTAVGEATGIMDRASVTNDPKIESIPAPAENPLVRSEMIDTLRLLWLEIVVLQPNQRVALLLNLRDESGDSPLGVLSLLGIASVDELAPLVGMPREQFVDVLNRLPMQDTEIAALLHLTQQQVINLRKAARERLRRRLTRLQRPISES